MPRYGVLIGYDEQILHQFDHDTGVAIRTLCQYSPSWTPANSNFDTTTGLARPEAISATGTSNLCSVAAGPDLFYAYDPNVCRCLAFDPASGSLFATFGGRRGIGAGKISPDSVRRSIAAFANGKVFLTDNDDGSGGSGNGFVLQYSNFGVFQAEYSIASWITALSAQATFDQITGWAYDTSRACYWALASGSANAYLLRIDLTGTPTGEVINLTTRLTTTLGITVSGHGGTNLGRTQTRGLHYHNGQLIFTSLGRIIRVDLTNTDGDALLRSEGNDVGPGNWTSDGAEFSYVLRDQSNGSAVAYVLTIANGSVRSYGAAQSPATGTAGQVSGAWDLTVVPTSEDPSTRTSRTLQSRARISGTTAQTIQMRAAISALNTRTIQMRARLLNLGLGSQRQITMRARIEEPFVLPDTVAVAWEMEDSLGTFSRGLQIRCASDPGLRAGDTVTLYAGYGTDRIRLMRGEIDDISKSLTTDSETYVLSVRDVGAKDLETKRYTQTVRTQFARTTTDIPSVTTSNLTENWGGGGYPEYPLYGNFTAQGETALEIFARTTSPWNQFDSSKYYPQIRDGLFRSTHVSWANPPSGGYQILRSRLKEANIRQTRYLGSPNLSGLEIIVKGATITIAIRDQIGTQTRIEYFRNLAQADTTSASPESVGSTFFLSDFVLTETTNIEETFGDKVLSRITETYDITNERLISREVEETLYFEPQGPLGLSSIQTASVLPSPLALPYQMNSVVSGIDTTDNIFKELRRTQTNHQYDERNQLSAETTVTNTFDTSLNNWVLDSVQQRFASQTTGGSSRIRRYDFTNDGGVLSIDQSDSQQIGGNRANPANFSSLYTVVTHQFMSPTPVFVFDIFGQGSAIDPGSLRQVWSYENPLLGQAECDRVLGLAGAEKSLQATHHWEEVSFAGVLDPNLHSGMAVSLEVAPGVFRDYWLDSVSHSFSTDEALTRGTAKRLTTAALP